MIFFGNILFTALGGLLAKVYSPRMDYTILPGGSCPDGSVLK